MYRYIYIQGWNSAADRWFFAKKLQNYCKNLLDWWGRWWRVHLFNFFNFFIKFILTQVIHPANFINLHQSQAGFAQIFKSRL